LRDLKLGLPEIPEAVALPSKVAPPDDFVSTLFEIDRY
jgi:hypothetical protein